MDLSQLHFAYPVWFWALLIIPAVWMLFLLYYRRQQPLRQLEKFIDKHLIPYLLLKSGRKRQKSWVDLLTWSLVWSCLVLALAGPRWSLREAATFTRDQSLVILLDLSESMNATDISPSRLGRAKQKIEDLLNVSRGVKIGLIAFAADAHMIAPMTEDKETIRHLLLSLDTDLVYVQGSKLTPALEMATAMLENEPGSNKALLVISDGGFEDASAIHTAKNLADKGIVIYTMGVGSLIGAPLKDHQGTIIKKSGSSIISKLEKEKISEISKIGQGRYFDADHSEQMTLIFENLEKRSAVQEETYKTERLWEEHFYLLIIPMLPFFLWWYRRGYIFTALLFISIPMESQASLSDYFYTTEQRAYQAYENEDYTTASHTFQDRYRKGVAYYRMGDYAAAEEMFRQSDRPEIASKAAYNLGNALVQQNKLKEAIAAYEDVLRKYPGHRQAEENLALVKEMLEKQQKQENHSEQNSDQSQQSQKPQESTSEQLDKNSSAQKNGSSEQNSDQPEQSQEPQKNISEKLNEDSSAQEHRQPASTEKKSDDAQQLESSDSEKAKEPLHREEKRQEQMEASSAQQERGEAVPRSQEDLDADLWLNQIKNDHKTFLKNKFYLESKKNGTQEGVDPW